MVRNAWISWLERRNFVRRGHHRAGCDFICAKRAVQGLAAIGFDPTLHTQGTRAAFLLSISELAAAATATCHRRLWYRLKARPSNSCTCRR